MRLEHYPLEKFKKEILTVLGRYIDLAHYKVFFFGSRVAGKGTERSDIDVGIEGPRIPTDVWLAIQEEIQNFPILYKIDIVDFNEVASSFREVALQYTELMASLSS